MKAIRSLETIDQEILRACDRLVVVIKKDSEREEDEQEAKEARRALLDLLHEHRYAAHMHDAIEAVAKAFDAAPRYRD